MSYDVFSFSDSLLIDYLLALFLFGGLIWIILLAISKGKKKMLRKQDQDTPLDQF